MATVEAPIVVQHSSYDELCEAALLAVKDNDLARVGQTLSRLQAVALEDLEAVIVALDELDGLARDVDVDLSEAAYVVRGFLPGAIAMLQAASEKLRLQEDRARRTRRVEPVADRVLQHLQLIGQPARSSDIAAQLQLDVTQVSRALSLLRDLGSVSAAERPAGSTDGRARWHQAA